MLSRRWITALTVLSVGFSAIWLAACGGTPTSPSSNNLVILLTDAPTDELETVNIYFVDLTVKLDGQPVETHVPVVLGDNPQDLLVLREQVTMLASGSVSPGTYEFIRINLDEALSNVVGMDGIQKPLKIPSGEIKILGPFEIQEDGTTTITLDFDADKSLVQQGNGDWLLQPVIAFSGPSQ